jgi:hypothetical protein
MSKKDEILLDKLENRIIDLEEKVDHLINDVFDKDDEDEGEGEFPEECPDDDGFFIMSKGIRKTHSVLFGGFDAVGNSTWYQDPDQCVVFATNEEAEEALEELGAPSNNHRAPEICDLSRM